RRWAALHSAKLDERRPVFFALLAAIGAEFVIVVWRIQTLWIAQALGLALLVAVQPLTCYYYVFFLLAAPLGKAARSLERAALFVSGTSALLLIWPRISYWWDDRYTAQSVVFVAYALGLLWAFFRPRPAPARGR